QLPRSHPNFSKRWHDRSIFDGQNGRLGLPNHDAKKTQTDSGTGRDYDSLAPVRTDFSDLA
ncbi:MAG: hypothetical protein AAFY72_12210, partial [Cyanobacteria bacterium J06649_4]